MISRPGGRRLGGALGPLGTPGAAPQRRARGHAPPWRGGVSMKSQLKQVKTCKEKVKTMKTHAENIKSKAQKT